MIENELKNAYDYLKKVSTHIPKIFNKNAIETVNISKYSLLKEKTILPRPDIVLKWKKLFDLNRHHEMLSYEINYLFWEPDIVLTKYFLEFIFNKKIKIGGRALRGFIHSIALKWTFFLERKYLLDQYSNIIKLRLKNNDNIDIISSYIFNISGHKKFAFDMTKQRMSFNDFSSKIFSFTLYGTEYAIEVLKKIANESSFLALSPHKNDRDWIYNEILSHLKKEQIMTFLNSIIDKISQSKSKECREEFKNFISITQGLGDPRLPSTEMNWKKGDYITRLIIEIFSEYEIEFFFNLFFDDNLDGQGRKSFWLEYAHAVKGTRIIKSSYDSNRLSTQLNNLKKSEINHNIFASSKSKEKASAFLMDFGEIKIVEFNQSGHACFFYDKTIPFKYHHKELFWNSTEFDISELKNQETHSERLQHRDYWQYNFSNTLSKYSIRKK